MGWSRGNRPSGGREFAGAFYDQLYASTAACPASTPKCDSAVYTDPVLEFDHDPYCSVTGGYVYRGTKVKAALGRYFYGDYCSGKIWSLKVSSGKATSQRQESFTVAGLSSFGEDARGELYLTSLDTGAVYRLAG